IHSLGRVRVLTQRRPLAPDISGLHVPKTPTASSFRHIHDVSVGSYRKLTSWSTESLGSSPSTTAVIVVLFNVMAPLWLSRKAVSAASRPVAMRTMDCRGARHVAST